MKRVFLLLFLFLPACGSETGGTEFGNPTRVVTGALRNTGTCPATKAVATNSETQTTTATFDVDCSFELNLKEDTAYTLSFYEGEDLVATLQAENKAGAERSPVFFVSDEETSLDFGDITVSEDDAVPENEPAEQNDQDDDGINDFDDTDDDADGTADEAETDCDGDGFSDDVDAADPCDVAG